jgi:alcohol dehydrogenase class IV
MMRFTHDTLGQRVILASGGAAGQVAQEVARLGGGRVMAVHGQREDDAARQVLGELDVGLRWTEVRQHVPVELADRAREAAVRAGVDVIVCVGGGSTTGLAKAVALTTGLPVVAVPTTYAGSEATDVWGLTQGSVKTTGADPVVLPRTVVYDAGLTTSLPVALSVASGLNALAHCVDSLWAPRADPINRALALEGARALADGLPRVVEEPAALPGREVCLYGAYLAAVAFASAGSGMHHKICHVLGGAFDLPHAETHAVVLPHVLAHNAPSVPDLSRRLAEALDPVVGRGDDDPATAAVAALDSLRTRLGAPTALREHGLAEADLAEAAARCLDAVPGSNPVPVTLDSLTHLLRAAWAGDPPAPPTEHHPPPPQRRD